MIALKVLGTVATVVTLALCVVGSVVEPSPIALLVTFGLGLNAGHIVSWLWS